MTYSLLPSPPYKAFSTGLRKSYYRSQPEWEAGLLATPMIYIALYLQCCSSCLFLGFLSLLKKLLSTFSRRMPIYISVVITYKLTLFYYQQFLVSNNGISLFKVSCLNASRPIVAEMTTSLFTSVANNRRRYTAVLSISRQHSRRLVHGLRPRAISIDVCSE